MPKTATSPTLAQYVRENSYARLPDEARQEEGWSSYKKGYELRIVVKTQQDLRNVRRLLQDASFKPGKAYRKAQQWVVPVYGKEAVRSLNALKSGRRKTK
jgi:hypothetical protein